MKRPHRFPLLLSSYHRFILFALSCASVNTMSVNGLADRQLHEEEVYSHSRSVLSSPSRKACAVSPVPPAPTGPKAAKCWA